jgi:hypothetical protein
MESTFVLRGIQSAQFLSPSEFSLSLTKNPGDFWAKILTTNQFQLQAVLFLKYIKNLNSPLCAPSHFTLHPKAVKLKGPLFKDEPWPLKGFLYRFSFQV